MAQNAGQRRRQAESSQREARPRCPRQEVTVDANDESEQLSSLFTMVENNLDVPFKTKVLGAAVSVERVDLDYREQIVAVCVRGRQTIPILDLPLPTPRPAGSEWIDAYRHWLGEE